MKHHIKKIIYSDSQDPDIRARIAVLNWILTGSIFLTLIAIFNIFITASRHTTESLMVRLCILTVISIFFISLYALVRKARFIKFVAASVVLFFLFIAISVTAQWGIINPVAILLIGLSIIMAGILISARQALYFTFYALVLLIGIQYCIENNYLHPNLNWAYQQSKYSDIIVFVTIYAIIALVSWLYNQQIEDALQRAQRSEIALKRQKALLEIRVEERTRELEKLQLEKMQQFYRFAELGRLSTALFHDLANHLTTINLDLEGLGKKDESKIMQRLQQNANYIDDVIRRVREQLLGKEESESFIMYSEIQEIITILTPKAKQAGVTITFDVTKTQRKIPLNGSLTRFRQMVINLISNAIDSYETVSASSKTVSVQIAQNTSSIAIIVKDDGCGIAPEVQQNIFKPFYSTKHSGIGIGLFMVKQITEQYFKGELSFVSSENIGTTFTIKIPKQKHDHIAKKRQY